MSFLLIDERKKRRRHTRLGSSAVFNIAFEREWQKKKLLPHGVFVFGHPSRKTSLNFVERTTRGAVLVVSWLRTRLFLISKMRKGNKERKKSLILAGKIKSKKNERNENGNYYLLWWSDNKQGLRSLLLSRSLGPITSWMFSTVFSYCCVFALFLHDASGL